jgi:membrane protein
MTTTDKFSWARVRRIWDFYFPAIKLPLILYPIVCISVSIASSFLVESGIGLMISGLISMIYGMAIYLFPVFFCRYKSPVMESMLPVTTGEKMVYFIGVTLLIPILLGQVPSILMTDVIKYFKEIKLAIPADIGFDVEEYGQYSWYGLIQQLPPLFACLFVVLTCRKNRVGLSIAAVIGTLVIMGILAGVISFLNITDALFSDETSDAVATAMALDVVDKLLIAVGIFSALFCTTLMTIAYFRIKNSQI